MGEDVSAGERALNKHLASAKFIAGSETGRWTIVSRSGPEVIIRVSAVDRDSSEHASFDFRFYCDDLPAQPPLVEIWDTAKGVQLANEARPTFPPHVADAFKHWDHGLYRPWERRCAGHNNWAALRPDLAWRPDREITFILEELHALVADYASAVAARRAA
ncbi:DUF7665 family protein [Roseiterribacter gracilis]|uniref:Uncharacterized protein n=1 Tax=Roseiterribacter gracilis TaxID=2812848 RepID=A0A8S8XAQ4_9PROT|nr:hypothetical protein TMPK1_27900 [Rhodospirillales bacterium TMPK1]